MTLEPTPRKSGIRLVLRAAFGFSVAAWLIYMIVNAPGVDVAHQFRSSHKGLLLTAMAAYGLTYPLAVVRWRLLLRVQGLNLPVWTIVRLVFIGGFFNLMVPGAVGGDVVKAAFLAGQTPGRRVESLLTIFVDRVLGAVGLLILTALSILGSYSFLRATDPRLGVAALLFGGLGTLAVVALWALTWRHRWWHLAAARASRRFVERILPASAISLAGRALRALDLYRDAPGALAACAALSVLVHVAVTLAVILLARAMGEGNVGIAHYFLAVQLANGAAMVPLTPGGLGGRDVILFLILSQSGADAARAASIPVMFSATIALYALAGGVVFIFDPIRSRMGSQVEGIPESSR